jgi:hypothetical protein
VPLCMKELRRCLEVSAGPAMLVSLDRSTSLVRPLPPCSLPAVEYSKLLDYFHSASGHGPSASPPHSEASASAVPDEQAGLRLLRRWYRQTRYTSTGKPDGDYVLLSPPDLASPEDSIFAPEATTQRLSQRQRTQYAAHELALLGSALAHAALAALYPAKDVFEPPPLAPAPPVVLERGGMGGAGADPNTPATRAPGTTAGHDLREVRHGAMGELEGGEEGGVPAVTPLKVVTGIMVGGMEESIVGTGSRLRERRRFSRFRNGSTHGASPDGRGRDEGSGGGGGVVGAEGGVGGEGRGMVTFASSAAYSSATGQLHMKERERDRDKERERERENLLGMSIDLCATPQPSLSLSESGGGGGEGDGDDGGVAAGSSAGGGEVGGEVAEDKDAELPLAYDGAQEGRTLFHWRKEVKIRDPRPCPSAVLLKYEASCHELLIALTAQECGEGGGSATVLPPKGLLALPTPLEKMARPIAEAVKWDASHVTDKVDFTKGVKVGIYVCT